MKSLSCTVTLSVERVDILRTWSGVRGAPGVYILDLLLALEQLSISPVMSFPSSMIVGFIEASPYPLE